MSLNCDCSDWTLRNPEDLFYVRHPSSSFFTARSRSGFTLVELLVVIVVIALLIGLLSTGLSALKGSAERTREMAAARALGVAWTSYATDNHGAVLPGYASGFAAEDPYGNPLETQTVPVAAQRWPWRLASYLGNDMAALYSDGTRLAPTMGQDEDYSEALYEVSAYPAFGLNSLFVGGDENYGGFNDVFRDTFGSFYVERLSCVRHPEKLTVFVSTRSNTGEPGSGTTEISEGYFRALPPAWTIDLWAETYLEDDPASAGNLSLRHDNGAITVGVDGGVTTRELKTLRDMRLWSDKATTAQWRLTPR
jgi:prepilin-type N-terminal cleavage/methylation domain-containing protein